MTIAEFKIFWNEKPLLTAEQRMKARLLKNFGAYTRAVAKNSMIDVQVGNNVKKLAKRDRKVAKAGFIISGGEKVSKPGHAAFSRLGYLKRFIEFDADHNEVVIGPGLVSGVKSKRAVEVLEHGGTAQIMIPTRKGKVKGKMNVTAQYRARPTMGLAFAKAIEKKLPSLIAGGIMREV